MKVVIAGAGPGGLLLAIYLIRRPNYEIHLYEKRPDPRFHSGQASRTFPIALQSARGLAAIREIPGLEVSLEALGVWCVGACIHKGRKARSITRPPQLSVDRNDICLVFLRHLLESETADGTSIHLHYETEVQDLNVKDKTLTVSTADGKHESVSYNVLVAADGSRSKIRQVLAEQGEMMYEQVPIADEYKSFYTKRVSDDGTVVLDPDKVHAWMQGTIQVITVPLKDNMCSGAFIFKAGENPFSDFETAKEVCSYFETNFPDSLAKLLSQNEARDLVTRPVSTLLSVKCDRLAARDSVLLIGDAAHAVSASVGQGCNSALQDVMIFVDQYLNRNQDDWSKSLEAYNAERLEDAHALRELSDYSVPHTKFMRFEWIMRNILRSLLPTWLSQWLLRPLPMELLSTTNLSYTDVLDKTRWWIDRIKHSTEKN